MPGDYASHTIPGAEKNLRDVLAEVRPISSDSNFLHYVGGIEKDLEMNQYHAKGISERYARSIIASGGIKGELYDKLLQAASDYDMAREIAKNVDSATKSAMSDKERLEELDAQHKDGTLSPYDATEYFNLKNPLHKIPDRFYPIGDNIVDRLTGNKVDEWESDPGDYSMSMSYDSPQELADAHNEDNLPLSPSWTGPHPDAWLPELGVEKYSNRGL
jgi:hypothetical protein